MKVFIHWSGDRSKQLAAAIHWWLPNVLQFVKPYFSPADIEKGARWANEISKELEQSQIGIIAMTEEALTSPWIMFEAGAISKVVGQARVCPIVFGIRKTDLVGPLTMFQAVEFNRVEVHQLLSTINKAAKEVGLPGGSVDAAFDKWWSDLEQKVEAIPTALPPSVPHRKDSDLLRENLELTRSLVVEHQKLVQALPNWIYHALSPWTRPPIINPETDATIRALRRRDSNATPQGVLPDTDITSKSE